MRRVLWVLATLAAALLPVTPGATRAADAEPGWGLGASLPSGRAPRTPVAVVLPDGSLLVATNLGVTKLTPNGQVDTSYGTQGSTDVHIDAQVIGVDPSGRALLVGVINPDGNTSTPGAVRLLSSGQVDASYGSGGTATVAATSPMFGAVDAMGRVLIEAMSTQSSTPAVGPVDTLFRLDTGGQADLSFNQGHQTLGLSKGGPILVKPDGSIVVIGNGPPPSQFIDHVSADGHTSAAELVEDSRATFAPTAAAFQPDGSIHVIGASDEEVVRPDLTLDPTFGQGRCGDPLGIPVQGGGTLSLLADGRTADVGSVGAGAYDIIGHLFVRRAGRRDVTFGNGGHAVLPGFTDTFAFLTSSPSALFLEDQSAPSGPVRVAKVALDPAPVARHGPSSTGFAWLVGSDGGVLQLPGVFGKGPDFCGSLGAVRLNEPIVGAAGSPDEVGYWLVGADGGVFTFGDAAFHGSTGAVRLNQPVVGMAPTPDGGGYWLVARDGGVFSFGDATYFGSTGAVHLNQPIVGMAATVDGGGYWLVGADGGIFAFGDAVFYGSAGGLRISAPIVGMQITRSGAGYWLAARDGGAYTFGDAGYAGNSLRSGPSPVVAITDAPPDTFTVVQADGSATNSDFGPLRLPVRPARPIVGIFSAG